MVANEDDQLFVRYQIGQIVYCKYFSVQQHSIPSKVYMQCLSLDVLSKAVSLMHQPLHACKERGGS